ncbi:MAG: tryptophan--tRNA ligase [Acidimicrobiales bacterium]
MGPAGAGPRVPCLDVSTAPSPGDQAKTVFSGIQPTGAPHLGNYFGALRWWVDFQDRYNAFYCVVDLHALTVPGEPEELSKATLGMATLLLACGLDPERCTLFAQSHVPQHAELAWLLECTASMGELSRMTQFKDKTARAGEESARVGLFAYPVLMAADILLYDAELVPVGDDQRQHLELTRDLAQRWNSRYGPTFRLPEAAIAPPGGGARIMDLQGPDRKMSKSSESDAGRIHLFDPPKMIERKLKRAVTDLDPPGPYAVRWDPGTKPGVSNLLELLAAATGGKPAEVASGYESYGQLKSAVADAVISALEPLQERYRELAADPGSVQAVLAAGARKASEVASVTLERARASVGLLSR